MLVEFRIRIAPKVPEDHPSFRKFLQVGDVVNVRPAGWPWGKLELASAEHVILTVEVDSLEQATADFMTPEEFDEVLNPVPLPRAVKVDTSMLPEEVKTAIAEKDPAAVMEEFDAVVLAGEIPIFTEDGQTDFKIPVANKFDIYTAKIIKADALKSVVETVKLGFILDSEKPL